MANRDMDRSADVIVVGLGAMGSATADALARAGRRVFGIDRWSPPHTMGSSHGRTRIIREAYFEAPAYVPIVRRALELWLELEDYSGRTLYTRTQGLTIGPEDGMLVRGARASALAFQVPHQVLSADEVHRQFPGMQPLDDMVGVLDERAGVLFPEVGISTMLARAESNGAVIRRDEAVVAWEPCGDGVLVRSTSGDYRAAQLVLACGAWMPRLVPELAPLLGVVRQPIHWFEPASHAEEYAAPGCPVTLWEYAPERVFYTLPDFGDGLKAAVHYEGQVVDPDQANRHTTPDEDAQVSDLLRRFMPHAKGHLRESQVCFYTNTPDLHFVIDRHPGHAERVVVVSACSGHGFKFAPAIGETVAHLLAGARPRYDLSMFRMSRFVG
jgi:sarcosine oxidase